MFWDVFDKSTTSLFFCCWISQQLHSTLPVRMLSNSFVVEVVLLSSVLHSTLSILPEALRCSILSRSCSIFSMFSRSAVEILSFLLLFYLVLTGVVSESILFLELLILVIFVIPLFYRVLSVLFIFSLAFSLHLILFFFHLVPNISGRDLLLVGECCDAPRPTLKLPFHLF